ncbi:hypothetical protein J6O48_08370 [bacterium]|nr:hypothetical protein [bacterium]
MTLYKTYENTEAVGTFPLCNFGGLEILDILYGINDYAVACFNFGTGRQQIRKHKIHYTPAGRSYIRKQGVRYYFDEIMRV